MIVSNNALTAQTRVNDADPTEFFEAIRSGDTNRASELLENNTNLVFYGNVGVTGLLEASEVGHIALVKRLIQLGVDVNAEGPTFRNGGSSATALVIAVRTGNFELAETVLKLGACPNQPCFSQNTALHDVYGDFFRLRTNRMELANLLLDYGADPFIEAGYYKNTPIGLDIRKGTGQLVSRMLGQDSKRPLALKVPQKLRTRADRAAPALKSRADALSTHGAEWIFDAITRGESEAVKALLASGVSLNNSNCPTLFQSFALAALEASRSHDELVKRLRDVRERLKPDDMRNADPAFVFSILSMDSGLEEEVEMSAPERWQKLQTLLLQQGLEYDVFSATALGDLDQAKRLLAKNRNVVQLRDCQQKTLLHWSVETDRLPMLSFWIEAGAPLEATNSAGETALHLAAKTGKADSVKALLAAHASTNVRDTNGFTALDVASRTKQSATIRLLLPENPVASPERDRPTCLHAAAARGNVGALVILLESPANLEARNELGLTPLQVAVTEGHLGAAALLVDRGANINALDPEGNTLLHQIFLREQYTVHDRPSAGWLAKLPERPNKQLFIQYLTAGQFEQGPNPILQGVSFLLACGMNASVTNRSGETVMQIVTAGKAGRGIFFFDDDQAKLFKLLGGSGANLEQRDGDGNTALHRLVNDYDDVERLAGLIEAGADINATNKLGQTPLHKAAEHISMWDHNDPPVNSAFQLLLYRKAKVNLQDKEGRTPLHVLAVAENSFKEEATRALLDAGADPNLRDKQGRTPAHLFLSGEWPWRDAGECIELLKKSGADLNAKDEEGRTPLHYLAALADRDPIFFIQGLDDVFGDKKMDFNARDKNGNTPAIIAAKGRESKVFDWLEKHGADLDITNNAGKTARLLMARKTDGVPRFSPSAETDIFQAIRENNVGAVERLLKADPQLVNQTNRFGQTPIRTAAMQRQTNMVNFLESHGAEWDALSAVLISRTDALEKSLKPLSEVARRKLLDDGLIHIAAANNDPDSIKLLLSVGSEVNAADRKGLSPLGHAILKHASTSEAFLIQHGARLNLFDAIYADDLKTVSALLERNSTLAASTNAQAVSALTIAAAAGRTNIMRALLKHGADVNTGQFCPASAAAFFDRPGALEVLMAAGVDVKKADNYGFAPLHWAALGGAVEAAGFLLKHQVDVNQPTVEMKNRPVFPQPVSPMRLGNTPLHLAAMRGETNLVRLLIQSGANVNAPNAAGATPLSLVWPRAHPFGYWPPQMPEMLAPLLAPRELARFNVGQPFANDSVVEMLKAAGAKPSHVPSFRQF